MHTVDDAMHHKNPRQQPRLVLLMPPAVLSLLRRADTLLVFTDKVLYVLTSQKKGEQQSIVCTACATS